jgi:phage terminase large subunit-like protein
VGVLPAQRQLLAETAPRILVRGGVGSGKTRGGAIKAFIHHLNYPKIDILVTVPDYNVWKKATLPTYLDYFTPDYYASINLTDKEITLKHGGHVWFQTTNDPYALRGPTVGFIHMDEGASSPALAYKECEARLRQPGMPNQLVVTTTPRGFGWDYQEFIAEKRKGYIVIQARTEDNHFNPSDYLSMMRQSYKDPKFALQQLEGEYVQIGGDCPFSMKVLNQVYHEAKEINFYDELEAFPHVERGFIYTLRPPQVGARYIIGADAATGLGEDDSAFVVGLTTVGGIKVVAWGKKKIPETEFADLLAAQSHMYNDAQIIVEDAPVGKATLIKLNEMHCDLIRKGDKLGFPTTSTTKPMMVEELAEAIRNRSLEIYSLDIIEQLMSYIRNEKGQFEATAGARDDYVSALMMLVQGIKYRVTVDSENLIVYT